ncbi:hypothetical protein BC936DRAFT_141470 [Jimgerdemannia flammicorona]|uniref:Uncharacterized protein n=1 Tax=Jimgerdemannia flammicorona TaxID=994334 RepID=A0A433A269_9FUNG|nr:hypothetical protein BC936DRAFT_141470 [Jimgerdemannia flammicorona]
MPIHVTMQTSVAMSFVSLYLPFQVVGRLAAAKGILSAMPKTSTETLMKYIKDARRSTNTKELPLLDDNDCPEETLISEFIDAVQVCMRTAGIKDAAENQCMAWRYYIVHLHLKRLERQVVRSRFSGVMRKIANGIWPKTDKNTRQFLNQRLMFAKRFYEIANVLKEHFVNFSAPLMVIKTIALKDFTEVLETSIESDDNVS